MKIPIQEVYRLTLAKAIKYKEMSQKTTGLYSEMYELVSKELLKVAEKIQQTRLLDL